MLRDMAVPAIWSKTQPAPTRHPPGMGEHNIEVLRELGYDDVYIDQLVTDGVTVAALEKS